MSFQKAHNISNELGEVLVTTSPIDLSARPTDWAASGIGIYPVRPSPAVAGRSYRVLEVGCTIESAGSVAYNGQIQVGTAATANALVRATDTFLPATTAVGETYSTNTGGANTWSFQAAGTGNVDSDGYPFLNVGEQLQFTAANNVANTPTVIFFARLAPVVSRDVFA